MAETGLVVVSFLSARIDRVHRNRTKKEGGGGKKPKTNTDTYCRMKQAINQHVFPCIVDRIAFRCSIKPGGKQKTETNTAKTNKSYKSKHFFFLIKQETNNQPASSTRG